MSKLEHRGIVARTYNRVQEELVVVLPVDPGWIGQQVKQVSTGIGRRRKVVGRRARWLARLGLGAVVERGVLVQRGGWHVGQHLAVEAVQDAQCPTVCDPTDHSGPNFPPLADRQYPV